MPLGFEIVLIVYGVLCACMCGYYRHVLPKSDGKGIEYSGSGVAVVNPIFWNSNQLTAEPSPQLLTFLFDAEK